MRKLTDLAAIIREMALRKQRAAEMRRSGAPEALPEPRGVYQDACEVIGQALVAQGFRYAKSGPHLTRKAGDFTYWIGFQSSAHNVRGEYIALWIHANVLSKAIKAWRRRFEPQRDWDFVAGGQIGNLDTETGWSEWDLADSESRLAVIQDAVGAIRSIIMPFFARFADRSSALNTLDAWPVPGLEIVPAIELALAYDERLRAQSLLERFFVRYSDLLAEYHAKLEEYRRAGLPSHTGEGWAADLAKATIQYELTPVSTAA
jgi:uncharacterized protein DUF4304